MFTPEIPAEVQEYLSSKDALSRVQIAHRYPGLDQTLNSPVTRTAILNWLASDRAWDTHNMSLTVNCLEFLRAGAVTGEASIVKSLLLHPDPIVRVRAYEFLLTLYYPGSNREAMFLLLQNMLSDEQDMVRTQAANYIQGTNIIEDVRDFLKRWHQLAISRGWQNTESFELIERLLNN